jgi:hypothetical protein
MDPRRKTPRESEKQERHEGFVQGVARSCVINQATILSYCVTLRQTIATLTIPWRRRNEIGRLTQRNARKPDRGQHVLLDNNAPDRKGT